MSEIKVNKISPRSGTTVTLGDSGDTFTIPAGATINNQGTATNFGATGAASWTTTVKTNSDSGFTATAGEGYFLNTSAGTISVNLPAGSAGAVVAFKDYAGTWDTNNVTLVQNGSDKIGGSTNNAILSAEGSAVTLVFIDSTQGWLVTDDGLQSSLPTNPPFLVATGGTVTTSGDCKIHTFTGPGNFCVSCISNVAANNQVSYIVVAGGGAGGTDYGGGGGAGGFREDKSPVTPYTASPLEGAGAITVTATTFPITVGAGGAGVTGTGPGGAVLSNPGNVSTFSTISSAGGGRGGSSVPSHPNPVGEGGPGGSGGGGSWDSPGGGTSFTGGTGNTPPVSPAQGTNGGRGKHVGPTFNSQGGGGGATVNGTCAGPGVGGGPGGAGATTSITGTPTAYAGGGGASSSPGAGGTGGGGSGNPVSAPAPTINGTANTGGGGGGQGYSQTSGAGGSGVVIIRYKFQ